jgi:hypothetical protein
MKTTKCTSPLRLVKNDSKGVSLPLGRPTDEDLRRPTTGPDAELRGLARGLRKALILAIPFWIALAVVAVALRSFL